MITVFSTLTADVCYTEYVKGGGDMPVEGRKVLIKGGAGLASKHLITPQGVATRITDEELAVLEADYTFRLHRENGFIKVEKGSAAKADADVVAADMASRDNSAPVIPDDYQDEGELTVKAVSNATPAKNSRKKK